MLKRIKIICNYLVKPYNKLISKLLSKHPVYMAIVVFLALAVLTLGGYLIFFRPLANTPKPVIELVIINYDHTHRVVPSTEPTVGALIKKLKINIYPGDIVQPSLATTINQDDFRINIIRSVPVEIIDGSKDIYTRSAASTPRSIVNQAKIHLYPEDYVHLYPVNNFVTQDSIGEQVVIDRATPVNFNLYGTPLLIRTHASNVGALLKQKHIILSAHDQVEPSLTTAITKNMQIFLIRNGEKLQSVTQTIPMPTQIVYNNSLAFGTSAVQQQGSPGQEVITYQDNLKNGIVVSQTKIQTVVTVPTVTQIDVEGTNLSGIEGDMALAGIPPRDYAAVSYIVSHESGWCPTKWEGDIGYCPPTYTEQYNPADPDIGYGLCQSTPAIKMSYTDEDGGSDWATDPVTQLKWCNWYAHYGSANFDTWQGALNYWEEYGNW